MNKALSSFVALLLVVSFATPAFALTKVQEAQLKLKERKAYQVCTGTARQIARCESVRARRTNYDRFERVKNAQGGYDKVDLGHARAAARERALRRIQNEKKLRTRRTYRQLTPVEDHNTQMRDFLNDYRQKRLDCMLEDHGRPRNLCFQKIQNEVRQQMKATRGQLRRLQN